MFMITSTVVQIRLPSQVRPPFQWLTENPVLSEPHRKGGVRAEGLRGCSTWPLAPRLLLSLWMFWSLGKSRPRCFMAHV